MGDNELLHPEAGLPFIHVQLGVCLEIIKVLSAARRDDAAPDIATSSSRLSQQLRPRGQER